MKYQKPALSITQQIAHWESKGLVIRDQAVAQTALRFIGLFRLKHLKVGKTPIASTFGLGVDVLESWLHCLTYLRNVCAHHGMVCHRKFVFRPKTLQRERQHFTQNQSFYCYAAVIQVLLKSMQQQPDWHARLKAHLNNYPTSSPAVMGFPANWDALSLWN